MLIMSNLCFSYQVKIGSISYVDIVFQVVMVCKLVGRNQRFRFTVSSDNIHINYSSPIG